jgi:hypothetical protein
VVKVAFSETDGGDEYANLLDRPLASEEGAG